jgi:hypothetical protein
VIFVVKKSVIGFVIILVIMIAIAYVETGFNVKHISLTTVTTTQNYTPTANSTITTTIIYNCTGYQLNSTAFNKTSTAKCILTANYTGIWVAAGNSSSVHIKVVGANNQTYVNQTLTYDCVTFFKNLTVPPQIYTLSMTTGLGGGACGSALLKLNMTTIPPPKTIYTMVYNGNFSSGEFTGWNVTGAGFGTAPLNITHANKSRCYVGKYPWSNYNATFFASTYHCGLQNSPGNLTSSPFIANKPFLNFKIISPQNANLYVEILYNGSPSIIAHYNTYNLSFSSGFHNTTESAFRNATIPLTTVIGKVVQIRVVAKVTGQQNYISIGQFYMSSSPNQDPGVLSGPYIYGST